MAQNTEPMRTAHDGPAPGPSTPLPAEPGAKQRAGAAAGPTWMVRALLPAALAVTVLVIAAAPGALPVLSRRARSWDALKIEAVENACASAREAWFSSRRAVTRKYLAFAAALLLAVGGISVSSGAVQRFAPAAFGFVVNLALAVATTAVLGLFAVRLKLVMFQSAGRLDWMMNAMALGAGVVAGLIMNYRKHCH